MPYLRSIACLPPASLSCTRPWSSPHNAQTCLNTGGFYYVSHKETQVGSMQRAWEIRGRLRQTGTQKSSVRRLFFTNCCHLSSIPLIISLSLYVTHIVARNIISCLKQEVKNNISHRNLGSGESCLTGMADYWCIFNKVKDLQWCMWLPFQSGHPCHLFGAGQFEGCQRWRGRLGECRG